MKLAAVTAAAFVGAVVVWSLPTYFLWNWLMPTIFGIKPITLWQTQGASARLR